MSQMSNSEQASAEVLHNFERGMSGWASAVDEHRMAPPDQGFASRLAGLAAAAAAFAQACRDAHIAQYEWPPARKANSEPPYELRPETGRRGPQALWRRFDSAVERLRTEAAGTDMLRVARAYDQIAAIASKLADAVADEDRDASSRARRSA